MAKNGMLAKIGSWAFIGGIILAGLVGIYQATTIEGENLIGAGYGFFGSELGGWIAWILAILGVIVGILAAIGRGTITSKETPGFLGVSLAAVINDVLQAGPQCRHHASDSRQYEGGCRRSRGSGDRDLRALRRRHESSGRPRRFRDYRGYPVRRDYQRRDEDFRGRRTLHVGRHARQAVEHRCRLECGTDR